MITELECLFGKMIKTNIKRCSVIISLLLNQFVQSVFMSWSLFVKYILIKILFCTMSLYGDSIKAVDNPLIFIVETYWSLLLTRTIFPSRQRNAKTAKMKSIFLTKKANIIVSNILALVSGRWSSRKKCLRKVLLLKYLNTEKK